MTTEIAIMNKQTVVLAADSAVSMSDKVFQSANKIFSLSKYHPVGVMVYSSAEFMGIPLETIIKTYREAQGDKSYPDLIEYANKFLQYLTSSKNINNNRFDENEYISDCIYSFATALANNIATEVEEFTQYSGTITHDQVETIVKDIFENHRKFILDNTTLPISLEIDINKFISKYNNIIENIYNNFNDILKFIDFSLFAQVNYELITHCFPIGYSGIVFAGFGNDNIYPKICSYRIGGIVDGKLHFAEDKEGGEISAYNGAFVVGFAQEDIIAMFMEGAHPNYMSFSESLYTGILDELNNKITELISSPKEKAAVKLGAKKIIEQLKVDLVNALEQQRAKDYSQPVVRIISILPPAEVASLAEALVNITTIQRQVSSNISTVGGPTDVAMITKGDGFVWVKRKHYFNADLNHQFFANYFRGKSNEHENR